MPPSSLPSINRTIGGPAMGLEGPAKPVRVEPLTLPAPAREVMPEQLPKYPNPVCSECTRYMLAGVQPLEPAWFCPDHVDAEPIEIVDCKHCDGKGWERV